MPEVIASFALPASFFLALAGIIVLITVALTGDQERKAIVICYLLGLFAALVKIWLLQKAPQWADVSLDSNLYQLHAEAFSLHWLGQPIDARAFRLNGFINWRMVFHDDLWRPEMPISYASVFGTHEWLYAALLGCWHLITVDWQLWAMYSNAVFAAAFPAASYGIVRCLGGGTGVAKAAAALTLIDPSTGVNASWLLKDTLAGLFAVLAIWATLKTLREPAWSTALILCLAAAGLSMTRFVAYVALVLALVFLLIRFFRHLPARIITRLNLSLVGSLMLFGGLYAAPQIPTPVSLLKSVIMPISAQKHTLAADDQSDEAYDLSVALWHARLAESPLSALVTSAARTLFAPYPWVVVSHGLSGTNGIELYYLGMPLWIICLPGIVWGILICMQRPHGSGFFIFCMLFGLLGAYTLFLGEWSTRQRVFMLPIFFAYAAIGWNDLRSKYLEQVASRRKNGA